MKLQSILLQTTQSSKTLDYDRLVLAAGSQVYYPSVPGLNEYAFNIDSFDAATKLADHLKNISHDLSPGCQTVVVVGGGFTGLEIACELPARLQRLMQQAWVQNQQPEVIIVDHHAIGSTLGTNPQPAINKTLLELGIKTYTQTDIASIQQESVTLDSGEIIPTNTVIWTTGMRANPLTSLFQLEKDHLNRIVVDSFLRIPGAENCFAAGDVASALVDTTNSSVMSCQHARPQG
ncbi:NAD(P)/FAD-dependent oxidoreductase [Legionella hackeliae]|uniref:Putative enzyme n=1 Tax=Legionella hackeliae TaxID=449 RepID=A0A0A8UUC8_LEGHA|nr:FAD-dependent oxidoreductase [Legionella hackeliae]KTD14185.1 respiratory NADH dehydrogenase 2/cupric reductase [Legionella hackeliae]CEK10394.1 putative enzyme [Legionella hackeliae]STX47130.1 respiratory NADH dehydrogenase 2/cupric reductase [Legionella hackeliae]